LQQQLSAQSLELIISGVTDRLQKKLPTPYQQLLHQDQVYSQTSKQSKKETKKEILGN
jgi:hypothetical protein